MAKIMQMGCVMPNRSVRMEFWEMESRRTEPSSRVRAEYRERSIRVAEYLLLSPYPAVRASVTSFRAR